VEHASCTAREVQRSVQQESTLGGAAKAIVFDEWNRLSMDAGSLQRPLVGSVESWMLKAAQCLVHLGDQSTDATEQLRRRRSGSPLHTRQLPLHAGRALRTLKFDAQERLTAAGWH
jgi:hypothetical protein